MNVGSKLLRIIFRFMFTLFVGLMIHGDKLLLAQELTDAKTGKTISMVCSHDTLLVAEKIRVLLMIKVESRDSKKALNALAEHQEKVKKEFINLGAIESAIDFTIPTISMGVPGIDDPEAARKRAKQQSAQLRNLNVRGRLQNEEVNEDAELPIVFSAASRATAEWSLSLDDKNSNVLLPSKIRASIDAHDLRGKNIRVVLSEDEQKVLNPLISSSSIYSSERTIPEVILVYVARPSESLELEIAREAFKKASNQANSLAGILGRKITGVRTMSMSQNSNTSLLRSLEYSPSNQTIMAFIRKDSREVIHDDANLLRYAVNVSVQFEMEP